MTTLHRDHGPASAVEQSPLTAIELFDALRPGPTWRPWRTFIQALYGEPLAPAGLALFRKHTGRNKPRDGGYPEAVAIVGVQSGKTALAAALAVHAGLTGARGTHALMLAQDQRGAIRTLLKYVKAPFETIKAFQREVTATRADGLELANGVSITAYPCRPAAVRGLRACIVCVDELAFFTTTDGNLTDREMLRVARGRLATTGGKLIVLSSPYGASGALYELHKNHFGKDDSDILVWQASAPEMNPTLPADYLLRMEVEDPDAYRSEVLGEFRAGVSTFIDIAALNDAVDAGIRERAPEAGTHYFGFADAASGSGNDSFALGVAHRDGERLVLDVTRSWCPPFNPSGVIAEAAAVFKRYNIHSVHGDRYAPGFVAEGFRANSVTYLPAHRTTSEMYLEFAPLLNTGCVRLLDNAPLLRELRGLERRRGQAGRDKVDHRGGAHDDLAVAGCGALVAASARQAVPRVRFLEPSAPKGGLSVIVA